MTLLESPFDFHGWGFIFLCNFCTDLTSVLPFIDMDLVIVESPTKAKTLSKFLGKKFEVEATMGHVRDLPKSKLGVDVEHNFDPEYTISPKAKKVVAKLKDKAQKAEKVYLATDPDREGEAIAWHVLGAISEGEKKKATKKSKAESSLKSNSNEEKSSTNPKSSYERVVFHEITKEAVEDAFNHPRKLDNNLIDAQQARRVLDRIVGYKLSPLLWKKVRYGLSAGRVQSVAVRMVVEREEERKNFKPEEYWSLGALFETAKKETFEANLAEIAGKKAVISSKEAMDKVLKDLKGTGIAAGSGPIETHTSYTIASVEKAEKKRNPYPPFTTSTLQQAGSNKLGFTAKRTMSAAQKLFEAGFITYHRTDSFNLSSSFLSSARGFINGEFGEKYLPEKPNFYKNRAKNSQEAHEAIRPVNVNLSFSDLGDLGSDEQKIYQLIWQRALSSQMLPGIYDQTTVLIDSPDSKYRFKAVGSIIKFEGWLKIYGEVVEDSEKTSETGSETETQAKIPDLKEKEQANLIELKPGQHFTEPPARFTEASLIKSLEEEGIGRPSTYAPTISTILDRGYVAKEGKYFVPQDIGAVTNRLLVENFPQIVDYSFTAGVEESLDKIAEGEKKWVPVLREFYDPFIKNVTEKDAELTRKDFTVLEETAEKCPECGKNLIIKLGKYGRFKSCSGFPECKYASPIVTTPAVSSSGLGGVGMENSVSDNTDIDAAQFGKCPECKEGDLKLKDGRFGKFIACSAYPKCKFTKPYQDKIGVKCPLCKEGDVVVKKGGKFKKIFYGCSRYPECKFVSNKDPRATTI